MIPVIQHIQLTAPRAVNKPQRGQFFGELFLVCSEAEKNRPSFCQRGGVWWEFHGQAVCMSVRKNSIHRAQKSAAAFSSVAGLRCWREKLTKPLMQRNLGYSSATIAFTGSVTRSRAIRNRTLDRRR